LEQNLEQSKDRKVLVVDDDKVTRRLLAGALEKYGYAVAVAANADEASKIIQEKESRNFVCAVVDYRMPGKDGLEFLTWLRKQDETLSAIMLTAEGDKSLVASILREGAVDFLEKPVELNTFRESVSNGETITLEKRRLADTDSAVNAVGEDQLQLLGVDNISEGQGIKICYCPVCQAGGDFIGVFDTKDGSKRIIAGDVSGHDLRAAYFSTFSQGVLRGMMHHDASDQQIFSFFNKFLNNEWNKNTTNQSLTSVALCGIEVNPETHSIKVVNSGFPTPYLVEKDGKTCQIGIGTGPLGWFDDDNFEIDIIRGREGCSIYLWSDGLEDFAVDNGISVFALAHRLFTIGDPVARKNELKDATDDVLLIRFDMDKKEAGENHSAEIPILNKRIKGDQIDIVDVSQEWIESSLKYALPEIGTDKLYDIIICIREALLNALTHGCKGLPDNFCDLRITYKPTSKVIRIRVKDSGDGHDFNYLEDAGDANREEPDPTKRNTGFILLRELPDNIITESRGRFLTMDFEVIKSEEKLRITAN